MMQSFKSVCWAGVDRRPSGVLPMKIASQCREQAREVYYGVIFEIKKGNSE